MNKHQLKFHHLGIACRNIEICLAFIKKSMNVKEYTDILFDEHQNAYVCLVILENGSKIELISGEVVESIIKKGIFYYHTCYLVADIIIAIEFLKKECNAILVSPPKPGKLYDNKLAAFLYTPIGLIELLEDKK